MLQRNQQNAIDLFDTVNHLYVSLLSTSEDLMTQLSAVSVSAFIKRGKRLAHFFKKKTICYKVKGQHGWSNNPLALLDSVYPHPNKSQVTDICVFLLRKTIHLLLFATINLCYCFSIFAGDINSWIEFLEHFPPSFCLCHSIDILNYLLPTKFLSNSNAHISTSESGSLLLNIS